MLLYLALGGVAGTLARYGIGLWVPRWAGTDFPWGTLLINVIGCFVLGAIARVSESAAISPEVRGMVAIGFCGAFTTFSTFSYETVGLLQAGQTARAFAYALGSLLVGVASMMAGLNAGTIILRGGS